MIIKRQQFWRSNMDKGICSGEQLDGYIQKCYYQTIVSIYKTDNFKNQMVKNHQGKIPQVLLIGLVMGMEKVVLKDAPFYKAKLKTIYDQQIKEILVREQDYREYLCKHFNRILKNRTQKYVFTNLRLSVLGKDIYFQIGPATYIMQVHPVFYQKRLGPMEKILDFKYSNFSLRKLFTNEELSRNCLDGFVLGQVRQKFEEQQRSDSLAIAGFVEIQEERFDLSRNKKMKEMILKVTQVNFKAKFDEIGVCKIIIRYSPESQQFMRDFIKNHHLYLFLEPQPTITQLANIVFLINTVRHNPIIKLSHQPMDLSQNFLYQNMLLSSSNKLLEKTINRNIIKLEATLVDIEVLYASFRCRQCWAEVKYQSCRPQCMKAQAVLRLWGNIRAADDDSYFMLSLEHEEVIEFLQLANDLDDIERLLHEEQRSVIIYNSYSRRKNEKNEQKLPSLSLRLSKMYVERTVVGYAKLEFTKTYRDGLSEEQQQNFQTSFQNTRKYFQTKKIFLNGVLERKGEDVNLIPYIKVLKVI